MPIKYATKEQKAVVEYRINNGYQAYRCNYMSLIGLIYLVKDKHMMVITSNGYDIKLPGIWPTKLELLNKR